MLLKIETPELSVIEESKAAKIKATFEPMAKMLEEFESSYNELLTEAQNEITKDLTMKAKRLRLDIGKVRIDTGKLKDKQKEYIKLEDKAIMGVHNVLVWAVKEKEDKLKEIESFFEIQEQQRIEALQAERVEKLSIYVENANERDLAKFAEDEFEALFAMKKKEQEDRIAAEKKAEAERIAKEKAESEERKRISEENEQLKKEAVERERLAKIESDKRIAIENERIEKEKIEKAAIEAKERKQREEYEAKIKIEREAKEKIEREEKAKREKLEAEIKAKEDAERKAKEDEAERIQAELVKGDSAKVKDLIKDLESLKSKYSFKSAKNKKMYDDVNILVDRVVTFIKK